MSQVRFKLKSFADIAAREPPAWLVADLIQARGLIAIYGESTAGKSFFALHLAAHLAMGRRWAGRRAARRNMTGTALRTARITMIDLSRAAAAASISAVARGGDAR